MAEQTNLAFVTETNDVAACELFGRLDQGLPARAIEPLDQCRLDLRLGLAADPPSLELGRNHLGVIDHKLIAWLEPLRQLRHDAVVQARAGLDHQKPCGIARLRGAQRDPLNGQFEVEEIGAHGQSSSSPAQAGDPVLPIFAMIEFTEYWMPRFRGA